MSKNIFITGGSGFLGQEIIRQLDSDKYNVYALVRSEEAKKKVEVLGAVPVEGDMENLEAWKDALKGMDVVVHAAAPLVFWAKWSFYHKSMVEPSAKLYMFAERLGVKRFVFISSDAVMQGRKDLIDIDEQTPYPSRHNSFYGKAKMLIEKFILNQKNDMQSIILRPPFIWGLGGKGTMGLIENMRQGKFFWIDKGRALFEKIHVKNAAYAVKLSIETEKKLYQKIYFVTDGNPQSAYDFFTKLASTQGIVFPHKNISKDKALFIAGIQETLGRLLNYQYVPKLKFIDVAFLAMSKRYKIDKIRSELGYRPIYQESQGLLELEK